MNFEFFLTSALEKVFPGRRPTEMASGTRISAWRGTKAAVQLVYYLDGCESRAVQNFQIQIEGAPTAAVMRSVGLVPSDFPCYENADDYYITKEPGLFPDPLEPMKETCVRPLPRQYRSVWLSWDIPEDAQPGEYVITVAAKPIPLEIGSSDVPEFKCQFVLSVGAAKLPEQTLIHTEWFHTDCLANYYHVEVFSDEYWRIVENFIRAAGAEHGINMLLTPVFTPPLDTEVGGERLTVQLVDVIVEGEKYFFGFDKLRRWIDLCRKYCIRYLEIPHLFTQWGAYATPKIEGTVNGERRRIFGWDVPADSPAYREFLEAFLPALRIELKTLGYDDEQVFYHISDEPSLKQLDSYLAAKKQAEDLLEGCQVIDALSNVEFYKQGIVKHPIPSNDHIQDFYDEKVPDLWVYYCCAQGYLVPNRFYAMESARNRIMGVLIYLYDVKGFLQWGFNFYNSQLSRRPIDPYYVTHADYGFPSGDGYLVYPGADGTAWSSIRAEVQDDALLDLRALKLLESLAGRETVEKIIYEGTEIHPMTFMEYPREADYLLRLRERVAEEIAKRMI